MGYKYFPSISRDFRFEMAHALTDHPGLCAHIHGHSYKLRIEVSRINEPLGANGMVEDFSDLNEFIQGKVVRSLDHSLMIQKGSIYNKLFEKVIDYYPNPLMDRIHVVDFNPTAEGMVKYIKEQIEGTLSYRGLVWRSITLWETENNFATLKNG